MLSLVFCHGILTAQSIKSPQEFLRTTYKKEFTPHHLLVDYMHYVAENSDMVHIQEYGQTNEDRPLLLLTISDKANMEKIDEIKASHIESLTGKGNPPGISIVWLSFGVHGNEAGASESSMNVIYELVRPENKKTKKWLKNTVVILDPSLNPDGYNRYSQWVRGVAGDRIHPSHIDREHMEQWPSGRVNHYLFDLNRDWVWQTQVESRQRVAQYQQWKPHVHVDFHEMGFDDGYYFAPAAEPFHKQIKDYQRRLQQDIGKNNASHFDRQGWLYFTREIFDLFYPSYGDTYPLFNGAIGMTYEQAGHGKSGRAISLSNGDTLTISDRIAHHTTTALSTIEEASRQEKTLTSNLVNYYHQAISDPQGKYQSYVIKKNPKAMRLVKMLDRNYITYGVVDNSATSKGYNYTTGKQESFRIEKGDIILDAAQLNGNLLQVLMDPNPVLSDSVTYDITSWALPHAYGVQAYALSKRMTGQSPEKTKPSNSCMEADHDAYAFAIPWTSVESSRILAKTLDAGIKVRIAVKPTTFKEGKLPRGSVVVTKADNQNVNLYSILKKSGWNTQDVFCLQSGFSLSGGDIGSSAFEYIKRPKILLFAGKGTDENGVGQVWHFFDRVLDYPVSIVTLDNMSRVEFEKFDVIILPDGYYTLNKNQKSNFKDFVRSGGKLIIIAGGLNNFIDADGFSLKKYATEDDKKKAKEAQEKKALEDRKKSYEDRERHAISQGTPGVVIKNLVDNSHPLGFGLGNVYFSLKTGNQIIPLLKNAWNVIRIDDHPDTYGFIGKNLKEKIKDTATVSVESIGSGKVIYMIDNPLYRGFWDNGLMMFANAVFLVE